jgi:LPXTG-site transpeptidase (sortase) family protein
MPVTKSFYRTARTGVVPSHRQQFPQGLRRLPDSPKRFPFVLSTILGGMLVLAGVLFLGYSIGVYLEILPGSRVTVPKPVALEQPRPTPEPTRVPTPTVNAQPAPTATMRPAPTRSTTGDPVVAPRPTVRPITGAMLAPPDPAIFDTQMVPADAEDRPYWGDRPRPALAVHLEIPAVDIDTDVTEGGIITNKQGQLEWQTVPFIAVQYRETALIGARGNAVISGHVVTIAEGNVFRNLYKVNIGDEVGVETADGHFTYVVEEVKLVKPAAVEVMAPSISPKLTLITCGGEFDTKTRSFSDRQIVVAHLADWGRLDTAPHDAQDGTSATVAQDSQP